MVSFSLYEADAIVVEQERVMREQHEKEAIEQAAAIRRLHHVEQRVTLIEQRLENPDAVRPAP